MNLLILLFLILSASFYLLLCSGARLPTIGTTLTALRIAQPRKVRGNLVHITVFRLSSFLSRFIRISPEKRVEFATKLKMTGVGLTPETHFGKIAANLILRLLIAIPAALVTPLAGVLAVVWAVYQLWGDLTWLDKAVQAKKDRIDADMPRLASTLAQELQANRDVIGILTAYLPSACPDFRDELRITLADMRSGSPDKALSRMGSRVGSSMLYEIIQGLQGVMHGDNSAVYFEMLEHDFKQTELQNLRMTVKRRPGKVQLYSTLMLGCLLFSVLIILFLYAWSKAGSLI